MLTPQMATRSHLLQRSVAAAVSAAPSDEELAVSMAALGAPSPGT